MSGNAFHNGLQQPMFAPVSQQGNQLGEDIDLNEIFADYFISEFEDPLNAYTSSMANYSGAAVALAQKQQQVNAAAAAQQQVPQAAPSATVPVPQQGAPTAAATTRMILPTGGIKTALHTGHVVSPGNQMISEPPSKRLKEAIPVPTQAPSTTPQASVAGAIPQVTVGNAVSQVPMMGTAPQVAMAQAPVGNAMPQVAMVGAVSQAPTAGSIPQVAGAGGMPQISGGSAISGRLGFSVVGGQVALPQRQVAAVVQQGQALASKSPGSGGVSLPVGVGIRLGGVGGVSPATAQAAPRQGAAHYTMWGGPLSGGAMSEQAVAERRQRNREHAKRSRVRKKFMLESLQEQVRALQKENVELRMIIQQKLPRHAQQIIADCCAKNPLFADPGALEVESASTDEKKETYLARSDFSLIESLTSGQQNFVLSDPRLPDNPIVYASPGFYTLTGYTQDQVLGRNCRFLQGPGTDPRAVDIIRTAITNGSDATTCLLNYKSDGTPFWNQFFVAALRDSDNCIVNFVGVQCEVEPETGSSAVEDKVNSVLPLQNKHEGEMKP